MLTRRLVVTIGLGRMLVFAMPVDLRLVPRAVVGGLMPLGLRNLMLLDCSDVLRSMLGCLGRVTAVQPVTTVGRVMLARG
jgi:hypothetical protein